MMKKEESKKDRFVLDNIDGIRIIKKDKNTKKDD